MRSKAKIFILVATLLGGFQAFPSFANTGGQEPYGEWGCHSSIYFYNMGAGGIFIGNYDQAMQQMKNYLERLDAHHVWSKIPSDSGYTGKLSDAAYTCQLRQLYNR
ncbi:hypothetical protein [Serratia marcescens]|uniref:hypothetical protein n=1 Tax=Serratia marcescens TaxID=615 RepID=UPI000F0C8643|nr:hypothetical protein [Serratia marcescens]BBG71866.1 hypothetical protein SERAS_46690 [Serratia marcescens]